MDDKKLEEMHEKVIILHDRLYGQDGHEGDIPEMKRDIETAIAFCYENKSAIGKMKAYVLGAATAGVGGITAGLRAILG